MATSAKEEFKKESPHDVEVISDGDQYPAEGLWPNQLEK